MGYTTEFEGKFELNKKANEKVQNLLKGLNETRRMKRNVDENIYGVEGEFYFNFDGFFGQTREENILDYNRPPKTQPGLWCNWRLDETGFFIEWDNGEKFYYYVEWLEYIIEKVLIPNGYVLNGEVKYQGEDEEDNGTIIIENNDIL